MGWRVTHHPSDPVSELLAELHALGVELKADGETVRFRPRQKVTPELLARIKADKPAMLALLETQPTAARLLEVAAGWRAEWREAWEERAGIMEFDGGLPRAVAEDRAFHELLVYVVGEHGITYFPGSIPTADLLGIK